MIDNWEILPLLYSFETTLEKHIDIIIINSLTKAQVAAQSLITPRDTPKLQLQLTVL